MFAFVLRRLAFGVSLILFATTLTFFLVYSDSSTIARNILGENASRAQVEARAAELGLDRPLLVQFLDWLRSAVTGDLGTSYFTTESVSAILVTRAPVTLSIVLGGVLVTALLSVALGMLAAVRRGWIDRAVQVLSVTGMSLPNFWVGLMLVVLFAVTWQLFPATGYVSPDLSVTGWLASIALPVAALALSGVAAATQQVRGAVIDVLEADYIRTLRSRGLSERSILFRHALKNAASPGLTVLSLQFIGLLGGAIVIEKVFALPGLGSTAVESTIQGDIPVLLGVVAVTVVIVVVVNLVIDLANGWVNPKVTIR
ncbi:ABC transporter permease [Nocardioides coralli]|uniref:ABC transporter permease n=1 Tax=Nocardioides coralli TaxID=2872154 RepID=UPI001CA44C79|nr:ABC transporter permease [Nocardioides coralli]QZY30453.1 ABC transporter permease [Nocardioides coralli]